MSSVEIYVDYSAVGQLLRGSDVKNMVYSYAKDIASKCGSGYAADTYSAGTRVIASAYTETEEAMQDNLENNTLLKGLQ